MQCLLINVGVLKSSWKDKLWHINYSLSSMPCNTPAGSDYTDNIYGKPTIDPSYLHPFGWLVWYKVPETNHHNSKKLLFLNSTFPHTSKLSFPPVPQQIEIIHKWPTHVPFQPGFCFWIRLSPPLDRRIPASIYPPASAHSPRLGPPPDTDDEKGYLRQLPLHLLLHAWILNHNHINLLSSHDVMQARQICCLHPMRHRVLQWLHLETRPKFEGTLFDWLPGQSYSLYLMISTHPRLGVNWSNPLIKPSGSK